MLGIDSYIARSDRLRSGLTGNSLPNLQGVQHHGHSAKELIGRIKRLGQWHCRRGDHLQLGHPLYGDGQSLGLSVDFLDLPGHPSIRKDERVENTDHLRPPTITDAAEAVL